MEKHIFTSNQCASLKNMGVPMRKDLFTGKEDFYTPLELLDCFPKAMKINGLTCTLVMQRSFIPEDPLDQFQPFSGWTWIIGYCPVGSDDFETLAEGDDLADAIFALYCKLYDDKLF